jgi:hypothetical protein
VIQAAIAVVPIVPVLVPLVGLSTTVGVGAILIAIAGAAARVMQVPAINGWINRLLRAAE